MRGTLPLSSNDRLSRSPCSPRGLLSFSTYQLRTAQRANPTQGVPAVIAASELIYNLPKLTGLTKATVRGVYRRLNETGIFPVSHGAKIEKLNSYHVAMLLLALLVDVPVKDSAPAACAYYSLVDENGNKIGDALVNILDSFKSPNAVASLAYKSRIEVDCNSPRVCVVSDTTEGTVETLYGLRTKQWTDIRVRRSMTISGKVLFELAKGVHFNRWPLEAAEIS
jgi:hypothetical protein